MKIIETPPRFPLLSFRDLEIWLKHLAPAVEGSRVQRVFVPEAPLHPLGFWLNTLVMEFHSPSTSGQLLISLRPQECGMVLHPPRTFRPAPSASRSGFHLALSKLVTGSRLERLTQVPGDRIVVFRFQGHCRLEMHLHLIPGKPVGVLLQEGAWLQSTDQKSEYPDPKPRVLGQERIESIPIHPEWFARPDTYRELWVQAETASLLRLRKLRALQKLESETRALQSKRRSLEEQLRQTEQEPDWMRYGNLLQANLYLRPRLDDHFYSLTDPMTGLLEKVPGDHKRSPEQQLEQYFHLAKRKKRKSSESSERLAEITRRLSECDSLRERILTTSDDRTLQAIDQELGLSSGSGLLPTREQKKIAGFSGKQFVSQEGLVILVGRNASENLELTFKIARGNDIWFHVKARPGSHTVILLPPTRSASLETLLDAANLCILYSGGRDWGKTEVDYTLRKHVKKIKNQTEVSYSSPKTLSVVLDAARLKRLGNP
jgi:predicted ribosome quality control (RQC) complex YloA/Tae2 family protein